MPHVVKVGLRFRPTDAKLLEAWAARVESGESEGNVSTFREAARAAASGEPLVVVCAEPREAIEMAAFYTLHGVSTPAVEALSGQ